MAKSADAFRTISEVAEWLETPAHVLRFWESKFSQVKPVKRAGGRRYYRPADMKLLGGIKKLLHEDGMTIKGVQKMLREEGIKPVAALSQPLDEVTDIVASELAADVPPEQQDSTVLSFQRGVAPPSEPENIFAGEGPSGQDAATARADDDAPPAPEMPGPAVPDAAAAGPEATPQAPPTPEEDEAESDPSDPPEAAISTAPPFEDADTDAPQDPAAPQDKAPPADDQDPADGPSDAPPRTEPEAPDAPQPADAAPPEADADADSRTDTPDSAQPVPPATADLPDDPPDDIAAPPGVLTAMLARQRVPPGIARRMADLAARLTPPPGA